MSQQDQLWKWSTWPCVNLFVAKLFSTTHVFIMLKWLIETPGWQIYLECFHFQMQAKGFLLIHYAMLDQFCDWTKINLKLGTHLMYCMMTISEYQRLISETVLGHRPDLSGAHIVWLWCGNPLFLSFFFFMFLSISSSNGSLFLKCQHLQSCHSVSSLGSWKTIDGIHAWIHGLCICGTRFDPNRECDLPVQFGNRIT